MYLRWQRRSRADGADLLTAALVASERRDGKPRQRTLAFIGCIRDDARQDVVERAKFWQALNRALDTLQLERAEDQAIVDQVHRKVPHPQVNA